ncbi:MAG: hypothetical protein J5830_03115 [Clostridia bacterium]|nr:hypothetical protein [Clostridia bacterium]
MKKQPKRFDMTLKPRKTLDVLMPVIRALSVPDVKKHGGILEDLRPADLRPPYILLSNHNAFMDFKVMSDAIWPNKANYVVAIDGFLGREKLLRDVGCICKRKFTSDILLVRQIRRSLYDLKNICVIFPEARYSLCGTTAVLPESLGQFCRMMKVPVVMLTCHGHHVNSPFWDSAHDRGVNPIEARIEVLFTPEELAEKTANEINERLVEAFRYDDFAWQKEKGIKVTYPKRAEGLHKVLYQCPECGAEYRMASENDRLFCRACGKSWRMTELGELEAEDGNTRFSHIPDWYEWERENVRREVREGTYSSGELPVHVKSLPKNKFIDLGEGTLVHDGEGFRVKGVDFDGDPFEMIKPVPSMYSCHIEYDYLGRYGDNVDLNTLEDTWYIHPTCPEDRYSVTKMALATEELYYYHREKIGKPCKKGLA